MNKNIMLYGLLALGGILVYYSWKKNALSGKKNANSTKSGTFVDDVPVNPKVLGVKEEGSEGFNLGIKDSISQIIEPFVAMTK
jgi:hypothetical protein